MGKADTQTRRAKPHTAQVLGAKRTRTASVAEAKAGLSAMLHEVEQTRTEVTLVRRGVPVARLVPVEPPEKIVGFGWMRGTITELGDIVSPSGEEWDISGTENA